jgi:hypothetical protein
VVAAYTALYKNGRYIRLVYESTNNYFNFTPGGENQFNILVYMVDGKFYMDLNDFHATNTDSFGRNNWVSLFEKYTNVNSTDYNRIVKYFNSLNNVFWTGRKVEEVRFKDNLYVMKFRNPTNITKDDLSFAVIELNGSNVRLLNNYEWVLVDSKSNEHIKAADFVQKKYNCSIVLFSQTKNTNYGRHFEVSYIKNDKKTFANAYLRWIDGEKLFIED